MALVRQALPQRKSVQWRHRNPLLSRDLLPVRSLRPAASRSPHAPQVIDPIFRGDPLDRFAAFESSKEPETDLVDQLRKLSELNPEHLGSQSSYKVVLLYCKGTSAGCS